VKLIIEPGLTAANYWRDLWRYRELMYFLTWRDIAVRYKQTVIGVAWALIRPALTMVVFVLFRRLAGIEHAPVPDVLLVLSAVIPWQFFANAVTDSSSSLINNTNLISKVYFPRLIVPVSAVLTALVDLLITVAMLVVVMAWQQFTPGPQLLLLPLFVLLAGALSTGLGLFLSALNVEYRDFRYVVPFMVQLWMFATPAVYMDATVVGPRWQWVLPLNPAYGLILNFRYAVFGRPLDTYSLAVSLAVTALMLVIGCLYFRRVERSFADII
jgi:lipopolysaccharide transport system permease protein